MSGSGRLQFSPRREEQGTGAAGTVEVLKVTEQAGGKTGINEDTTGVSRSPQGALRVRWEGSGRVGGGRGTAPSLSGLDVPRRQLFQALKPEGK